MSSASKLIHIQLNFCIDIIFQCLLRPLAFEVFFIVVGRFTILIWKMADFASWLANLGKKYGKWKKLPLLSSYTLNKHWSWIFLSYFEMQLYVDGCWNCCWVSTLMRRFYLENWNVTLLLSELPFWCIARTAKFKKSLSVEDSYVVCPNCLILLYWLFQSFVFCNFVL